MEKTMFAAQHSGKPPRNREAYSLFRASNDLRERGGYEGHVRETSLYTEAAMHPLMAGALLVGAGLACASIWQATRE
jgi:hypothetical protein